MGSLEPICVHSGGGVTGPSWQCVCGGGQGQVGSVSFGTLRLLGVAVGMGEETARKADLEERKRARLFKLVQSKA